MNKLKEIVDQHHIWLNPLFIFLTTVTSALFSYEPSQNFQKLHSVKFAFYRTYQNFNIYLFIFCSGVLLIITIINSVNKKTILKLNHDLNKLERVNEKISENIKELFSGHLYKLSSPRLSFSTNERITLYIHNGDNYFVPFARYSANTKYGKPGRDIYPDNIGCIAKGWENKWHFCIFQDESEYVSENYEKYEMDEDTVNKLNMKSVLFAVIRIDDARRKPIGILVVESTNKNKYTERSIKSILNEHKEYIGEMVSVFIDFIPNPKVANAIEED